MMSFHTFLATKIVKQAKLHSPAKITTIKQVTAPNKWCCSICRSEIPVGAKCWKQGSKKICDNCIYVARESK